MDLVEADCDSDWKARLWQVVESDSTRIMEGSL